MVSCDFCGRNEVQINTRIIASDKEVAICYDRVIKAISTLVYKKDNKKENS